MRKMRTSYDIVVVGGGHAGCEAAAAAARMGASVALVTMDEYHLASMPCNPAMGGIGKGHLMHELDALGGVQAWASDCAGIQFKTLNESRGPAVWGPRAQCDKLRYERVVRRILNAINGLELIQAEVTNVMTGDNGVQGVILRDGSRLSARAVVLTTGTFLRGLMHTGFEQRAGGRFGEPASAELGKELPHLGVRTRRYKTGTPPRLARASIDFSVLQQQTGDEPPRSFSWRTRRVRNTEVCWVTRTPEIVQRIITDNLDTSPLYTGRIEGIGPRYCPSIEDKVVRFPHHTQHTVFLEPEGADSQSIYVNGVSTSLAKHVQEQVIRAIRGLEQAQFLRFGYAVEYDVVAPGQVTHDLQVCDIPGLYVAGQLVGTSGYEEAAALGFVAGVNAWQQLRGRGPFRIGREHGYIGVLVDDLVTQEHDEPYRMLTARAEHRLVLGIDSARERLLSRGVALGLVPERVFHVEHQRWQRQAAALKALEEHRLTPDAQTLCTVREAVGIDLTGPTTWAGVLRRGDVDALARASEIPGLAELSRDEAEVVVGRIKYQGYLDRHRRELERIARLRQVQIPDSLEYGAIAGLSREVVEKLQRFRPRCLAEAETIPGVTAAAVAILAGRLAAVAGSQQRR